MYTASDTNMPNFSEVLTWPQALTAIVFIIIVLGYPIWKSYLDGRRTKDAAEKVEHQVHPNSGKSLADSVFRQEKLLEELKATVGNVQQDVGTVKERQAADHERIKHLEEKQNDRAKHWWNN